MVFNPQDEPCMGCGREADECICYLAPDFPSDVIDELDTDYLSWDFYEEDQSDESGGNPNLSEAVEDEGSD